MGTDLNCFEVGYNDGVLWTW